MREKREEEAAGETGGKIKCSTKVKLHKKYTSVLLNLLPYVDEITLQNDKKGFLNGGHDNVGEGEKKK